MTKRSVLDTPNPKRNWLELALGPSRSTPAQSPMPMTAELAALRDDGWVVFFKLEFIGSQLSCQVTKSIDASSDNTASAIQDSLLAKATAAIDDPLSFRPVPGKLLKPHYAFSHDLAWLACQIYDQLTLIPLSGSKAEALQRLEQSLASKATLSFEEISAAYGGVTDKFKEAFRLAVEQGDAAASEALLQGVISDYRDLDPALNFDPRAESRRLAVQGFLDRAQLTARSGKFAEARILCDSATKLGWQEDKKFVDSLREQAARVRLRDAEIAAAQGDVSLVKEQLKEASNILPKIAKVGEAQLLKTSAERLYQNARNSLEAGDLKSAQELFDLAKNESLTLPGNPEFELERYQARLALDQARKSLGENNLKDALRHYAEACKHGLSHGSWDHLQSSFLSAANYNHSTQVLDIDFTSGVRYRYSGVPQAVYENLLNDTSGGSFFARQIRGRYQDQKLAEKAAEPPLSSSALGGGGFLDELAQAAAQQDPQTLAAGFTRVLVEAWKGNLAEAAKILEALTPDDSAGGKDIDSRKVAWLASLQSNTNPFTPEVVLEWLSK